MDALFINPISLLKNYLKLSKKYAAILPPKWVLVLAQSCSSKCFKVKIKKKQ